MFHLFCSGNQFFRTREFQNDAILCYVPWLWWVCDDFYIGKTKRGLQDRKTEHFKVPAGKTKHTLAVADHIKITGHNIKWHHFETLASGKTDYHFKINETSFMPELNANLTSDRLSLSSYNVNVTLVTPRSLAVSIVFK